MAALFLNVRLNQADAQLIDRLQAQTALTKSELVKRALHALARDTAGVRPGGLYELGKARFGRYGDVTRQAADIKSVVRDRLHAKRSDR